MNSLKSHISLILALLSIIVSIFLYQTFNQILNKYQKNITSNYYITIVSTKKIDKLNYPLIEKIEPIPLNRQLKKLKREFPNLDFSNIALPHFYKLKLSTLPTPEKLNELKKYLLKKKEIKRVLTYSSSQTKIYNLLLLLKLSSNILMIFISVIGFLLIIKQLEVWKLIHKERMYILDLFGAPFLLKALTLFKIAFLDSIIAIILAGISIYFIINSTLFEEIITQLQINFTINYFSQAIYLFAISITLSLISSIIVSK